MLANIGASLPNIGTLADLRPAPILDLIPVDCTFIQY